MGKLSWALAPVLALVLMSASPALADTQTLSVLGNGRVFVTPDVADVSVSVTRTAAMSRQALSAANRATDAVVRAIRNVGIPASDVQTQGVNVYPFTHKHRKRWSANVSLGIHITNLKLVGPVIDGATRAGASSVSGPIFSFSDPSAGIRAATRAAIADARRRADDAAAAIGYKVTGVQSMDLDPGSGVVTTGSAVPHKLSLRPRPHGTPTSIHPGTQEVDAQVAIVYTIAPA